MRKCQHNRYGKLKNIAKLKLAQQTMVHSKAQKKKKRRIGRRIIEFSFLAIMIILIIFAAQDWLFKPRTNYSSSSNKVALIDQLSIAYPNDSFEKEVIRIFQNIGFTTDVYSGTQVTINLYRELPTMNYKAVIFRVHQSTPVEYLLPRNEPITGSPVYLFTGELYNEHKYVIEQLSDLVVPAREINGSNIYFAIGPKFVQAMTGNFPSTVIILAGCSGLYSSDLADSFIIKGASIVVGWQRFVQMDYTDKAITRLLKAVVLERTTINRGMLVTISDVGLDPSYQTNLLCYPKQREGLTFSEAIEFKEQVIVTQKIAYQVEPLNIAPILDSRKPIEPY